MEVRLVRPPKGYATGASKCNECQLTARESTSRRTSSAAR